MKIANRKQIKKWTEISVITLKSIGLKKKEIADALAVTPKTVSNWLKTSDIGGTIPKKSVFVRLVISNLRSKGLNLSGETIGGSAIAGALLGSRFGGVPDGTIGADVGSTIGNWLGDHEEERVFIENILSLERTQASWDDILDLIEKKENLF